MILLLIYNWQDFTNFILILFLFIYFFVGNKIIDKNLFYVEDGIGDCLGWCNRVPACQSVNLGESKKGEWFCELTGYQPSDTDYTAEPQEDGFNNYSFAVSFNI